MRASLVSCIFLVVILFWPGVSAAQLVPLQCSGAGAPVACGTCEFLALVNNVIQFIILIASSIAVLIFMYAGFLYLSSGGNAAQAQKANSLFTNVVIGYVLILAAFLIVDQIMGAFVNEADFQFGTWRQIECLYPNEPVLTYGTEETGLSVADVTAASVFTAGDCSVDNFTAAGVPSNVAPVFSCIAGAESGCNLTADNPQSSAYGVLQVLRGYNNECHNLNNSACTKAAKAAGYDVGENLNCSQGFSGGDRKPGDNPLADACDAAAANFTCNAQAALCLQKQRPDFGDWTQGASHTKQRACVKKFGS